MASVMVLVAEGGPIINPILVQWQDWNEFLQLTISHPWYSKRNFFLSQTPAITKKWYTSYYAQKEKMEIRYEHIQRAWTNAGQPYIDPILFKTTTSSVALNEIEFFEPYLLGLVYAKSDTCFSPN